MLVESYVPNFVHYTDLTQTYLHDVGAHAGQLDPHVAHMGDPSCNLQTGNIFVCPIIPILKARLVCASRFLGAAPPEGSRSDQPDQSDRIEMKRIPGMTLSI